MGERIVVTGLGAATPLGLTVDAFWQALMAGETGAGPITQFDVADFPVQFGCEVKGFEPTDYFDRKTSRRLDRYSQFALVAADQALEHAGLADAQSEVESDRVGVVFGTGIGGVSLFESQSLVCRDAGPKRMSPFFVPMMISNMASGLIAVERGFTGPNHAVVSACATGNQSIADAMMLLRQGHADVVLCGGAEASITPACVGGFAAMKAMSTRNDAPSAASRPFDRERDGFVIGEGAGALVLETEAHARRRGATPLAYVAGIGMTADAHHFAAPDPGGRGLARAMRLALDDARMSADDVDAINAHATSTPLGDRAELCAIRDVFGTAAERVAFSSTKGATGHLLGAAGAVEAVAAVMTLIEQCVPHTQNTTRPESPDDFRYVLDAPLEAPIRSVVSNGSGFGGHNVSVVFKSAKGEAQ